jgi:signal transduction histidine kinase
VRVGAPTRSGAPDATGDVADLVRTEQVRTLYRQIPAAFAVHAALAGLLVVIVREHAPVRAALAWYASVLGTMALRVGLWLAWRRARAVPAAAAAWARRFVGSALLTGLAWGAGAGVLLPADSAVLQLAVGATVVCLAAGVTAVTFASAPAIYTFVLASVSPYAVAFALQGSEFAAAIAATMVVFVVGNSLLARGNSRLFTELITLRLDVAAQRDAAQQANLAKSRFLAAASHDLRQPLHAMTLLAGALDGRLRDADDERVLARLQDSLAAMRKLFNALLDISMLDAGIVEPRIKDVRLSALLDRLAADHAPEAREKGLEWRCPPTPLVARSDPALLETLVRNLIANAIRYTPSGSVSITCREVEGSCRIDVEDTGVGIPPELQREVFREFHQLNNPERDADKGLGLGLAIVDRLARLLEHRIELRSAAGVGSCFSVILPLGSLAGAADEEAAGEEPPPDADLAGMVVLVVDDQAAVLESTQTLLGRWGCATILAGSEEEALAAVRAAARPPELILADYRLRAERTGSQAIEAIRRELGSPIPALLVTGDTAPERLREAKASGAVVMSKPVAPARLRALLRAVRRGRPPG